MLAVLFLCAAAWLAVDDDHDVAELGPPVIQLAVDHDPTADPRPEREHDEVARPPPRTPSMLLSLIGLKAPPLEPENSRPPFTS